ncbi:TPM domain-containing protein, partial [Faecalicatena contorta]
MNKLRFMAVLLCLFLVNVMPVSASGEASPPKVMDEAELLSEAEEAALTEQIYGIGEEYQIDVILVMKRQIQEADLNAEAKNLYNQNGYGIGDDKNAIMLIIE